MKDPHVDTGSGSSSELPGSTASSFLERVKAHDAQAWGQLAALYGPLVYSWARRAGLKPEDAADVVQEVFRAVVTHIMGFRRDRPGDSFRGWLWTITQNKLRDYWRREGAQPEAAGGTDAQQRLLQVPASADSLSAESVGSAEATAFRLAVETIRPQFAERSWQAFWRVVVEGQCPADVAADLSMSVNAVYVARSRILSRLRQELGDLP